MRPHPKGPPQTGHASHANQPPRPRNKDRERKEKDGPQKRLSVDAPIPPAKRKNRRRKLSSSNESSTSESPSNASDFVHASGPHQSLDQVAALRDVREGGMGKEGGGGRRGEKEMRREHMLHGAPTYSSMGTDSHALSPVHSLETGRGKEGVSNR